MAVHIEIGPGLHANTCIQYGLEVAVWQRTACEAMWRMSTSVVQLGAFREMFGCGVWLPCRVNRRLTGTWQCHHPHSAVFVSYYSSISYKYKTTQRWPSIGTPMTELYPEQQRLEYKAQRNSSSDCVQKCPMCWRLWHHTIQNDMRLVSIPSSSVTHTALTQQPQQRVHQ
jgi:hypothetical protein